jgi:hypothetical protein
MRIWWSLPLPGPFRIGGTVWRSKSRRSGFHGVHDLLPGWQCRHNHSRLDLAADCANREYARRVANYEVTQQLQAEPVQAEPEPELIPEQQEQVSEWKPEWRNQPQPPRPRTPRGKSWSELSHVQKVCTSIAISVIGLILLLITVGIIAAIVN